MSSERTVKPVSDVSRFVVSAGSGLLGSFEFRAVRRIVAIWFGVFVVSCLTHGRPYNDVIEICLITVCCVGLVKAAAWTVFYGELTWQRILKFVVVVGLTALLGVFLADEVNDFDELFLAAILGSAVGLVPFFCAKKFLGWRILHPDYELPASETGRQFSIAEIMGWTTFFALLSVIANLVSVKLFNSDISQFLFFVFLGMIVPSMIGLVFFALVGRLSTSKLALVTPVYALGIAIGMSVCLSSVASGPPNVWRYVFWPNLIWFSIAGWAICGSIWILRNKGFVFAFGSNVQSISPESLREYKLRSLRSRISSTNNWRQRLSNLHAWIDRRLSSRAEDLDGELASLEHQTDSEAESSE